MKALLDMPEKKTAGIFLQIVSNALPRHNQTQHFFFLPSNVFSGTFGSICDTF
jgi:hypothetical protein